MPDSQLAERRSDGPGRFSAGVGVGFIGALAIWIAAPYKNYYIGGAFISDDFLPIGAIFLLLLILLVINPLIRLIRPRLALDSSQIAVAFAIMLVAGVAAGNGALRQLPYALAGTPVATNANGSLADAYKAMNLPDAMFPDKIGHNLDASVGYHFMNELPPGEPIPWGAWIPPLFVWGSFMLACYLMMIGMALIVLPQWQRNERLPFPLLKFQQSLIEDPDKGRLLPPLFRRRGFWVGFVIVLTIHILSGANVYLPQTVPAIPMTWNLTSMFTEEPWLYLPIHLTQSRFYFLFIGMAFFMPNRIGFSMWFFVVVYGVAIALERSYAPPFYYRAIEDQKTGAMFSVALAIVWLGRSHWAHVGRCMIGRVTGDADRRDRQAGFMFLAGCLGIFGWLTLVLGLNPLWSAAFLAMGFTISLLIARVVAETGVPFFRINAIYPHMMAKLAPTAWLSPVTMFAGYMMMMLFIITSRTSLVVHASHGLSLDKNATPKRQAGLGAIMVVVVMVGIVVSGAVHLKMNYSHGASIDGTIQPINNFGLTQLTLGNTDIVAINNDRMNRQVYSRPAHIAFGAALAGSLQWLCMISPKWPIHPLGLFLVHSWHGQQLWLNLLIGWLAKVLILRYGGARLYTKAIPFFMGIMLAEVCAVVLWSLVTVARAGLGLQLQPVPILPM